MALGNVSMIMDKVVVTGAPIHQPITVQGILFVATGSDGVDLFSVTPRQIGGNVPITFGTVRATYGTLAFPPMYSGAPCSGSTGHPTHTGKTMVDAGTQISGALYIAAAKQCTFYCDVILHSPTTASIGFEWMGYNHSSNVLVSSGSHVGLPLAVSASSIF